MTSSNRLLYAAHSRFLRARLLFALLAPLIIGGGAVQAQEPKRETFPPGSDKGAIVVVVSGASGMAHYRDFSSKLAEVGYYTVLMDGNDAIVGQAGAANLQTIIADSQSAPQAIPGKVALVGLSMGGAAALLHGAPLKDQVSALVAYYPAITRFAPDIAALAARLQAPVLLLAGEQDRYMSCCLIETMRALAAAPKREPFELVVYPNASHGFNLRDPRFVYSDQAAADAWARTVAFLSRSHPPGGKSKAP